MIIRLVSVVSYILYQMALLLMTCARVGSGAVIE